MCKEEEDEDALTLEEVTAKRQVLLGVDDPVHNSKSNTASKHHSWLLLL